MDRKVAKDGNRRTEKDELEVKSKVKTLIRSGEAKARELSSVAVGGSRAVARTMQSGLADCFVCLPVDEVGSACWAELALAERREGGGAGRRTICRTNSRPSPLFAPITR